MTKLEKEYPSTIVCYNIIYTTLHLLETLATSQSYHTETIFEVEIYYVGSSVKI